MQLSDIKGRINKRNKLDGVNYDRLIEATSIMPTMHGHHQRKQVVKGLDHLSNVVLFPEPKKGRDMLNIAPVMDRTSGFIDKSTGQLKLPLKECEKKLLINELKSILDILLPMSTLQTQWLARLLNNLDSLDRQAIQQFSSGYLRHHRRNLEKLGRMWIGIVEDDSKFCCGEVLIPVIDIFITKCMHVNVSPLPLRTFALLIVEIADRKVEVRQILLGYNISFDDAGAHVIVKNNNIDGRPLFRIVSRHQDTLYQYFSDKI